MDEHIYYKQRNKIKHTSRGISKQSTYTGRKTSSSKVIAKLYIVSYYNNLPINSGEKTYVRADMSTIINHTIMLIIPSE